MNRCPGCVKAKDELVRIKSQAEAALREAGQPMAEVYTCDECCSAVSCKYAFDQYNQEGACLAEK